MFLFVHYLILAASPSEYSGNWIPPSATLTATMAGAQVQAVNPQTTVSSSPIIGSLLKSSSSPLYAANSVTSIVSNTVSVSSVAPSPADPQHHDSKTLVIVAGMLFGIAALGLLGIMLYGHHLRLRSRLQATPIIFQDYLPTIRSIPQFVEPEMSQVFEVCAHTAIHICTISLICF